MPRRPLATRVALLGALYLVQGLPFGFQAIALPVMLRRQGIGLEEIGFAGALAAPWMLKLVWAPAVDAYHVGAIGRRRSWILPLQLGLALSCGAAAFVDPEAQLGMLLGLVLAMNLFAATLDVAVDGLAVDLLDPSELGPGNIAQVVGFKLGMLTTGGLMLAYLATLGWPRFFFVMAGLVVAVLVVTLVWREPEAPAAQRSGPSVSPAPAGSSRSSPPTSWARRPPTRCSSRSSSTRASATIRSGSGSAPGARSPR